jgi:hypothetical protein
MKVGQTSLTIGSLYFVHVSCHGVQKSVRLTKLKFKMTLMTYLNQTMNSKESMLYLGFSHASLQFICGRLTFLEAWEVLI